MQPLELCPIISIITPDDKKPASLSNCGDPVSAWYRTQEYQALRKHLLENIRMLKIAPVTDEHSRLGGVLPLQVYGHTHGQFHHIVFAIARRTL